jgi:hypothetical protein
VINERRDKSCISKYTRVCTMWSSATSIIRSTRQHQRCQFHRECSNMQASCRICTLISFTCERRAKTSQPACMLHIQGWAAPYLKRLVAGFPPRRPGFDPGSGQVEFVVDKMALGQVFPEYFGFPCQSSFHQLLHNRPHLSSGAGTIGQKWP